MNKICRSAAVLAACLFVMGCTNKDLRSVQGGECKVFEAPQYAVRGVRPYDQNWIDGQVESGVGGCGWKRPAARPAALDAPSAPVARVAQPRPGVVARVRARISKAVKRPAAAPVAAPAPVVVAPKPRDPVDELLDVKR